MGPSEVGTSLDQPIAWVSKRTGRMEGLGLIVKENADDHGVRRMHLTEKGVLVMNAITNIRVNPLFVELRRALDLRAPDENRLAAIWDEAERLRKGLTSNKIEHDLGRLFNAVLEASSRKVEGWYANEDLKHLFSTVMSKRWDERSRLLLIKIIGMAVRDGRGDRKYIAVFNGLIGQLLALALNDEADESVRTESIIVIGSMRGSHDEIPDAAFEAMITLQWTMLSPSHKGFELMESTVANMMSDWDTYLSDEQKEMTFRSVDRMLYYKKPKLEDLYQGSFKDRRRKIREKEYSRYRSLVSRLLGKDIPGS